MELKRPGGFYVDCHKAARHAWSAGGGEQYTHYVYK